MTFGIGIQHSIQLSYGCSNRLCRVDEGFIAQVRVGINGEEGDWWKIRWGWSEMEGIGDPVGGVERR